MNGADRSFLTPQERLALSRRAIVRHLNDEEEEPRDNPRSRHDAAQEDHPETYAAGGAHRETSSRDRRG